MEYLLKFFKNSLVGLLGITIVFSSVFIGQLSVQGQSNDDESRGGAPLDTPDLSDKSEIQVPTQSQGSQGETFVTGQTGEGSKNQTADLTKSATELASCALGGVVSSLISGLISSIINPDHYTKLNSVTTSDDRKSGGSTGWPPSADSIAYCIINAMIEYIANATIDWINSGFDGNPAFVENPQKFFSDIASYETASFLNEVVYNTTGLNICEPFRVEIALGLAGDASGRNNPLQCSMSDIVSSAGDFDVYVSGQSPASGYLENWSEMTQNPQNNIYGASFLANQNHMRRVALQQNTAKVDMQLGSGFLSFKKCSKDETIQDEDGSSRVVKGVCGYSTPGQVIEQQVNSTLNTGRERLVLADKFDQVVSALVNQLIKTALNQVLTN